MKKMTVLVAAALSLATGTFAQKNKTAKSNDDAKTPVAAASETAPTKLIQWSKAGRYVQDLVADMQVNEGNQSIAYLAEGQLEILDLATKSLKKSVAVGFQGSKFKWLSNDVVACWGDDFSTQKSMLVLLNINTGNKKVACQTSLGGLHVNTFQPSLKGGVIYFQLQIDNVVLFRSASASFEVQDLATSKNLNGRFLPAGKKNTSYFAYSDGTNTVLETYEGEKMVNSAKFALLENMHPISYSNERNGLVVTCSIMGNYPTLYVLSEQNSTAIVNSKAGVLTDVLLDNLGNPTFAKVEGTFSTYIACNGNGEELSRGLSNRFSQQSIRLMWISDDYSKVLLHISSVLENSGYVLLNFNSGEMESIFDPLVVVENESVKINYMDLYVESNMVTAMKMTPKPEDKGLRPIAILVEGGIDGSSLSAYSPEAYALMDEGFDVVKLSAGSALLNLQKFESAKGPDMVSAGANRLEMVVEAVSKWLSMPSDRMVVFTTGFAAHCAEHYAGKTRVKVAAVGAINPANNDMFSNYAENLATSYKGTLNEWLFYSPSEKEWFSETIDPQMKIVVGTFVNPASKFAEKIMANTTIFNSNENVEVLNYNDSFLKGYAPSYSELVSQVVKRLYASVK
jgi:hypothetical protein